MPSDNNLAMHHKIEDELRRKLSCAEDEAADLRAQNAALLAALKTVEALCERTASLLRTPQWRVVTAEGQAKLFASLADRAKAAIEAAEGSAE